MPNCDLTLFVNKKFLYRFLEGQDQTFKGNDLIIKTNGDINKLLRIEVNNVELDKSNYENISENTILTLNTNYLSSLSNGTYKLKFVYNDGELNTTFIINNINNPKTGDNILFYILMFTVSVIGLSTVICIQKKNFN